MKARQDGGFKAIELIVCTALVGLLTVVAIPNFVRVQTQTTVSQAKADLAVLKSGLEAYKVDLGEYPLATGSNSCLAVGQHGPGNKPTLERLTTPIAYISNTAQFRDPFLPVAYYEGPTLEILTEPAVGSYMQEVLQHYYFHARNTKDSAVWDQPEADTLKPVWYTLESSGPDSNHHFLYRILNAMRTDTEAGREALMKTLYDPTNGTVSRGSIWATGGVPDGTGTSMASIINAANGSGVGDWERYGK